MSTPPITDEQIDEIEDALDSATGGPWLSGPVRARDLRTESGALVADFVGKEDAAYVQSVHPGILRDLIARLRAAEAERDAALRELWEELASDGCTHGCADGIDTPYEQWLAERRGGAA